MEKLNCMTVSIPAGRMSDARSSQCKLIFQTSSSPVVQQIIWSPAIQCFCSQMMGSDRTAGQSQHKMPTSERTGHLLDQIPEP